MLQMLEMRLEAHYPQFKRVWVHGSNKGKYHLCITLFSRNWHVDEIAFGEASVVTFESVTKIVDTYLESKK